MASLKYRCTALAAEIACSLMDFASAANGAEPQADSDGKISVGPGVYVFPEFPGSSRLQLLPFPVQDIA